MLNQVSSKENKKVKNATKHIFEGKVFRSTLELNTYKLLIKEGFEPQHEVKKFTLMEGFYLQEENVYLFDLHKDRNQPIKFGRNNNKIMAITYTPDFYIEYKGWKVFIETKGNSNDSYPLKKKMFLDLLVKASREQKVPIIFFEPHNLSQVKQVIQNLKSLECLEEEK